MEILIIAPQKIDETVEQSLAEHADLPEESNESTAQLMKGVHLVETHENGKDWELWSESATSLREDGSWILNNVKVRFFTAENDIYYDVTGPKGTIAPKNKELIVEGDVTMVSSNGYVMKMSGAHYDAQTKKLHSDSVIKMMGPKVPGESRLELTGHGMLTNLNSNEFKILKNIKAKKNLQNGQLLTLSSESGSFNSVNYKAAFDGNLITDYGPYRVTGNRSELEVDVRTQKVKSVAVIGNVRLSDLQRFAVAERATMFPIERKLVLSGSPRLVQNNNELTGEEIVFFESSSRIQIKKAKAKFDQAIRGIQ